MTVLAVLGTLLVLLVVACVRESRSGRPAWGAHLRDDGSPTGAAARSARRDVGAVAATAVVLGLDGGDG